MELLHTSRQGIIAQSVASTLRQLRPDQRVQLAEFISNYSYSGFTVKFAGNLARLSSFTGKEYGALAQVMPIALISLRLDPLLIIGWCLVSEVRLLAKLWPVLPLSSTRQHFSFPFSFTTQVVVDDYQWAHTTTHMPHKRKMASFYQNSDLCGEWERERKSLSFSPHLTAQPDACNCQRYFLGVIEQTEDSPRSVPWGGLVCEVWAVGSSVNRGTFLFSLYLNYDFIFLFVIRGKRLIFQRKGQFMVCPISMTQVATSWKKRRGASWFPFCFEGVSGLAPWVCLVSFNMLVCLLFTLFFPFRWGVLRRERVPWTPEA